MTDCYVKSPWDREPKKLSLADAFNPEPDQTYDGGGVSERAARAASAACEAVGKLTALLIEKGVINIAEAGEALEVYPRPYFTPKEIESEDE